MLEMIRDIVSAGKRFAFETTLSGRIYVRPIAARQELKGVPGGLKITVRDPSLVKATEEEKKTLSHAELALIAMKRAAIKARRRAIRTQGYVATWRNGKMYRDTKV